MPPIQTVEQLLEKKWGVQGTTEKLNHVKPIQTVLFDRFVKDRKGQIGASFQVKIQTGSGVVLESVKPEDEHLIHERNGVLYFDASTARYALSNPITPEKLDEIESFKNEDKPLALAEELGEIQREHKESFDTSIEYQTAGALFNKVIDGKGKVLFELNYNGVTVDFKLDGSKTLRDSITEAKRHIKNVLGVQQVKIVAFVDPVFMDHLNARAIAEKLFENKQAKTIDMEGSNDLEVHGVRFEEYAATYKNSDGVDKEFVSENSCVFLPEGSNIFKLKYSRANDTKAAGQKPKLYFGAVEELPKGRGWDVRSECRPLVWNSRPAATPKGAFS
ncbi:major capsid protein [Sulfurimonas sp.]